MQSVNTYLSIDWFGIVKLRDVDGKGESKAKKSEVIYSLPILKCRFVALDKNAAMSIFAQWPQICIYFQ